MFPHPRTIVCVGLVLLAACAARAAPPEPSPPDHATPDASGDTSTTGAPSARPARASLPELLRAIETADTAEALRLLRARPQLARISTPTGVTALLTAARLGRDDLIAPLLERGAPIRPNTCTPNDGALWEAILHGHASTLRHLLDAAKSPRSTDGLLCLAARLGHTEIVQLLLARGLAVSESYGGTTPLHQAVQGAVDLAHGAGQPGIAYGNGHEAIVGLLLAKGARTDVVYSVGATPLELALGAATLPGLVRRLRAAETQPHLHADAWLGDVDAVRTHLDAHPRRIDATDGKGRTPLVAAILGRQPEVVALLLARGASTAIGDRTEWRPLAYAAWVGDAGTVRQLLAAKAVVDARDGFACTALATAAEHGRDEVVGLLLEAGADPRAPANDGRTPLHFAAQGGNASVVRRLIAAGVDAGARAGDAANDLTSLHYAADHGWLDVTQVLLDAGVDPNPQSTRTRNTPLHLAAGGPVSKRAAHGANTSVELDATDSASVLRHRPEPVLGLPRHGPHAEYSRTVELLLQRGAQAVANVTGETPLHIACVSHQHAIARALLTRGADARATDLNGATALHSLASATGPIDPAADRALIRMLVERGAELAACDRSQATPLHHAAAWGRTDLLASLVEQGADLEAHDQYGLTPLLAAINIVRSEVAVRLLELGASPATIGANGVGAIHLAASLGLADVVWELLDRGVIPDALNSNGNTPLRHAAGGIRAYTPSAEWAAIQAQCRGRSALNEHTREERALVARMLLERGAAIDRHKPTVTRPDGIVDDMTPLMRAADWGEVEVLHVLLAHGANPNARDHYGASPLHLAAQTPFAPDDRLAACAAALLAKGAIPDARMDGEQTPLHRAAEAGNAAVTQVLLDHRANPNLRDGRGDRPIDVARRHGHEAVVALLER